MIVVFEVTLDRQGGSAMGEDTKKTPAPSDQAVSTTVR
jgi:hypothetical protein